MSSSRRTREQLEIEARNLPRDERARLAEALLASLEDEGEIEEAWREEIRRRLDAVRDGSVEMIPAEEVYARLDRIVGE